MMSDYSSILPFIEWKSVVGYTETPCKKHKGICFQTYRKCVFLSLAEPQLLDLTFASTTVSDHILFPLTPSPKSGCSSRQKSQMPRIWRVLGMGSAAIRTPSRVLCVWRAHFLLSLLNLGWEKIVTGNDKVCELRGFVVSLKEERFKKWHSFLCSGYHQQPSFVLRHSLKRGVTAIHPLSIDSEKKGNWFTLRISFKRHWVRIISPISYHKTH